MFIRIQNSNSQYYVWHWIRNARHVKKQQNINPNEEKTNQSKLTQKSQTTELVDEDTKGAEERLNRWDRDLEGDITEGNKHEGEQKKWSKMKQKWTEHQ